jgi:hypothetical protein
VFWPDVIPIPTQGGISRITGTEGTVDYVKRLETGEVRRAAARGKAAPRKSGEPAQVISYRHTDTRVNNPEVGMVHPDNDPDQPKTVWAYDPHLDPALMFDSQRARVEKLIDNALASGDPVTMKRCAGGVEARCRRPT